MKHLLLFHITALLLLLHTSVQLNGAKQESSNSYDIICTLQSLTDNLKIDELVLSISDYEIEEQITSVVEELSLDRGTITEYVNCLKLIMKEQSEYDFKEEFQSIISDINSFDIKVSESSILQECLNTEMTNYRASLLTSKRCEIPEPKTHEEISQLLTLVFKRYEIVTNYNKHLLKHRLLTNIVNEVNRRNTKV
ncbi:unnamed protein product [Schistosoma guineensis]|nr:unnamed protein product [Schistosoma guineensis]